MSDSPETAIRHLKTLAIANQKGGVAKTTTSINLATALAMSGFQTLLVDCDPQANATSGLGLKRDPSQASTYDVLMGDTPAAEAIWKSRVRNLQILPSSRNLIGANVELVSADRREFRLRDALDTVEANYHFIVLDCPPALDLLTLNALVATERLLVPMQAEYFALEGVSELLNTVERIRAALNPGLEIEGVLLTMYDERTNLAQQVSDSLRAHFGDKLLKTSIPRNVRLAEAPSHGMPVLHYDPRSRGAEAYRALAAELLTRWQIAPLVKLDDGQVTQSKDDTSKDERSEKPKVRFWPYG